MNRLVSIVFQNAMISPPDILNHNELKRTWINSCQKSRVT